MKPRTAFLEDQTSHLFVKTSVREGSVVCLDTKNNEYLLMVSKTYLKEDDIIMDDHKEIAEELEYMSVDRDYLDKCRMYNIGDVQVSFLED